MNLALGPGDNRLAEAYADHLRERSSMTAEVLSDVLAGQGQTTRADLLRDYARHRDHVASAHWWEPGATCHVSLGLPLAAERGQLWFDPLEVSCTLVKPWLRNPAHPPEEYADTPLFSAWISLEPVASWQLHGAHVVLPAIPPPGEALFADQVDEFCALFSKGLVASNDWLDLKEAYGVDVVNRMWGEAKEQVGGYGATSSDVELLSYDEIMQWQAHGNHEPRETSTNLTGLPFRTRASINSGLWTEAPALPRVWND